jgi:hypothetical protein
MPGADPVYCDDPLPAGGQNAALPALEGTKARAAELARQIIQGLCYPAA